MILTREQVVATARLYLGTPFQHQGRLRGRACDCVGLPICVARDLGVPLSLSATRLNYDPFPADDTVLRELKKHLREKTVDEMRPGDIICINVPVPCHVGIVCDLPPGLGVIHAYQPNNKVVEHTINDEWRKKIAGVFVFPLVED